MKTVHLTIFAIQLFFTLLFGCATPDEEIIGVKCYNLPAGEQETIDAWKAMGINTAYVSEIIAKRSHFRNLAREAGIEVYLIFPVFYNPEALQEDSTLWAITSNGTKAKDGWVEFVCPSNARYRERIIKKAKKSVAEWQPDGLSIDFIRHFVYWEMVKPSQKARELSDACYCRDCLRQFAEKYQIRYPDSLKSTLQFASYIRDHYRSDWVDVKCDLITSMVDELTSEVRKVNPKIKFNLHAVPWRKDDYNGAALNIAGQDIRQLAPLVDYVSPMCYSHMLYREPEWVDSLVIDFKKQGVANVLPCIQVSESYLDQPFTKEEFCDCIDQTLRHQNNGIIFWSWEKLEQEDVKQKCVREIQFN